MSMFSGNAIVNMDGSSDPSYRYTMPKVQVKREGSSKMKKSVVVNLKEVSRAIGRPTEYLLNFLGHRLSATAKIEKDTAKAYIAGHHSEEVIQNHIIAFVREAVMCVHCNNPETACGIEGNKKHKSFFLSCKSCGNRTSLDTSDRFVKYMLQHPPDDVMQGHANIVEGAATAATALAVLADAEAEKSWEKKVRPKCSRCGHKTSKSMCGKCGANLRTEGEQIDGDCKADAELDQNTERVDVGDCRSKVQRWVRVMDQNKTFSSAELLLDFETTLCSSDTTASEQLNAVVWNVACDFNAQNSHRDAQTLQPIVVAKEVEPLVKQWSFLIDALYGRLKDASAGIIGIIGTLYEAAEHPTGTAAKDSVVLGMLLALRDHIDKITDEDLIEGCKCAQPRSTAMDKFIEFLEADNDSTDEDNAEDIDP